MGYPATKSSNTWSVCSIEALELVGAQKTIVQPPRSSSPLAHATKCGHDTEKMYGLVDVGCHADDMVAFENKCPRCPCCENAARMRDRVAPIRANTSWR